MPIDIDHFTEAELLDLNRRIVARLKFLQEMRIHARMLQFSVGESVYFKPDGYPELSGRITKYNRKTVTVVTDQGQHWKVSPGYLSKEVKPAGEAAAVQGQLDILPKR